MQGFPSVGGCVASISGIGRGSGSRSCASWWQWPTSTQMAGPPKLLAAVAVGALVVIGLMYAASRANEPGEVGESAGMRRDARSADSGGKNDRAAGGGAGKGVWGESPDTEAPLPSALTKFVNEAIESGDIDRRGDRWKTLLPMPPKASFDDALSYYWLMETNHGFMAFKLFVDEAPMHASSTVYLTLLGFYDNLTFHRVIPRFMAQGGCPTGTGTSGPGYKYDGEFPAGGRKHDKPGILSMANAGRGTDGSQFFITFVPTPHLDGKHTVFGELVEGWLPTIAKTFSVVPVPVLLLRPSRSRRSYPHTLPRSFAHLNGAPMKLIPLRMCYARMFVQGMTRSRS